ncbi:geminin isoform X2 [Episyrphus balteatus]|uniref:geminin isoform X2 n=1 Tax=Episyrphus balteatus TaxID=286459 RepID=UPI002485BE7E|nr:geminin isoform X2 [Episyrphus balteatus]
MSHTSVKKVFIQIESASEQQENLKNTRKTLKVLQNVATDKENLAGRPILDKISRLKGASELLNNTAETAKRKKIDTRSTQTSPGKKSVTAEDLTETDTPGSTYWELLAEKRREALEATLVENQHLHERIEGLESELNTSRKMLEETKNLVEVLTEMLNENEAEKEIEQDLDHLGSESESEEPSTSKKTSDKSTNM